jgi:hypothetical protein
MLPLGHVAYTWAALAWLQTHQKATDIDYRGAAIAALLPDMIDKPLSLTLLSDSGTSQGLSHTLVGQVLLTLAAVRLRPKWLPYALICNSHLLADQMWRYPRTLLFPFSGQLDSWKFMGTPSAMLSAYAEIVARPGILAVEALGLALLVWAAGKGKWYRKGTLKRLLLTGIMAISSPPSRMGKTEMRGKSEVEACE